jgi:hypothetical protein
MIAFRSDLTRDGAAKIAIFAKTVQNMGKVESGQFASR